MTALRHYLYALIARYVSYAAPSSALADVRAGSREKTATQKKRRTARRLTSCCRLLREG